MIKFVEWFFYSSVTFAFIYTSYDQVKFHSYLKKRFPRSTSFRKAMGAKVSELIDIYNSYTSEDLIRVEAELNGMKGETTAFDKISDIALKTIIGASITFFAAITSTSTGLINLVKDKIPEEMLIEQIQNTVNQFSKVTDGYGVIFIVAISIFCFGAIYYMSIAEKQRFLRIHFLAIEAVKKIQNHT
ncbi:hypothetical protein QW71_17295 [Paenibacillus sp. IHB B 3415]|uniref:hypothetical protein n=1 Tax=Paenibacillus sp. IHB B 3415 TaxID=867080 RepID=UPI0005754698|nr:hypothetical protein [Paenibacillus sp. IHB B 3415]KHL94557.1 hypothetical protein QW71_17295 [Paenibacillus sp. IHB B 3415]